MALERTGDPSELTTSGLLALRSLGVRHFVMDGTPHPSDCLRLAAPEGFPRFALLSGGLFENALRFEATLRKEGAPRVHFAFGADPELVRGVVLDFGAPGDLRVLVRRLENGAPATVLGEARAVEDGGPKPTLRVVLDGSRLRVAMNQHEIFGERGFVLPSPPEDGRVLLGVAEGRVHFDPASFEGRVTSSGRYRAKAAERFVLPELVPPVRLPPFGPLELVDDAELAAGLAPADAEVLVAARRRLSFTERAEGLRTAEALRERHPGLRGPAFVAGALRLLQLSDPAGAERHLEAAAGLEGVAEMLGDARWFLGDLDGAAEAYEGIAPPHSIASGRALVRWAEGDRAAAVALARAAHSEAPACRRCRQRAQLLLDLDALLSTKSLAAASSGAIRVLSDLDRPTAERVLAWTRELLDATRKRLPGSGPERPLVVLVCNAREHFGFVSERLGTARWQEVDGEYRPGEGLMLLRDDEDPAVLRRRLHHEILHHVAFERALRLPPHLEEGLAEVVAAGPLRGRGPASMSPTRAAFAAFLAKTKALSEPLELLFSADRRDGDAARRDYAEAWAAVHVLAQRDGFADGGLLARVLAASAAKDRGAARALVGALVTKATVRALFE